MISFLIRKMWNSKWLMASLLIGNILLIGIVSGIPLYSEAIMQRILIKDMQQLRLDLNIHPTTSQLRYSFNSASDDMSVDTYYRTRDAILPRIISDLDIPALNVVQHLSLDNIRTVPQQVREITPRVRELTLSSFEGQDNYLKLLQGRMPSDSIVDGNIIECMASEYAMSRSDLILDELMSVWTTAGRVGNEEPAVYLKVVGIYEAMDATDLFWTRNPNSYANTLLVSDRLIPSSFIENYNPSFTVTSTWLIMLDYNSIWAGNLGNYQSTDAKLKDEFNNSNRLWIYSENFINTLEIYSQRAAKLNMSLLVLQVPIYVLMAFYIFMVSRQILGLEQNDISVLKSRGAGRQQILFVYLLQSLFVGVLSLVFGIPLGMAVCRVLGASDGFLELVSRFTLSVRLSSRAMAYSGTAAFASIMMMLAPVIRFSRIAIVDYKRNKFGKPKRPFWQRYFIDVLCLLIAIYALTNFRSQREVVSLYVDEMQSIDPVLLLSSSLFILGMGLLCIRLFPLLVRLVFFIGKRLWSPAPYVSLLKIVRSAGEEQFVMVFLVFTLAVGIFSAKAARTINQNNHDKIMYQAGADIRFAEGWGNNMPPASMMGAPLPDNFQLVWYEPDYERFTDLQEVDAHTKVLNSTVRVRRGASLVPDASLMAIDTKSFGETLWTRSDLLPININYFLNAIAAQDNGVLLSRNFQTKYRYGIGHSITFADDSGDFVSAVVCGFVDYWPGFTPVETTINHGGAKIQVENSLVVANLGYVQSILGVQPYEVWMKTNTPTNAFMYDFINEKGLKLISFNDAAADVAESKGDPILQGTNGVLTVGFIVSLVICFTGFLIYWILSIKSRVLQFGVFRAMGMTMRNIIGILINEQFYVTITAVIIGAVVGEVSSRLFVPLIQWSYSASDQVIPLLLVTESQDYSSMFSVIGIMIVICLALLGAIVSRLKIAQALKLGED